MTAAFRAWRAALLMFAAAAPLCATVPAAAAVPRPSTPAVAPAYAAFLVARVAAAEGDVGIAATEYLRALAVDPTDQDLTQQAFTVSVMAGRPEAVHLATLLPDNPVAQLLLIDTDARAGNWAGAERRARALPSQGLTLAVQPLLVAWAEQGAGRTDAALATLRPLIEGSRMRGLYALHGAMIADLGGKPAEAARLYRLAQQAYDGMNLRLAQVLSSWQARSGRLAEAQQLLETAATGSGALALSLPSLVASTMTRPVAHATDGMAEAYLALAAAVRQQEANDLAVLLLHLALDLRPDFSPARILLADILEGTHHLDAALSVLAPVTDQDPVAAVVRLNRALLENRAGRTDEALRQLDRLAHDYPASAVPLIAAGDLLRDKNRYPEAITVYTQALARGGESGGESWLVYYARGVAYERSHQWPLAEADFRRALDISPDQPVVLNYLGYSWADQGANLDQARRMIDAALKQRPDDGAIVDSLGWVTLRQGDPQGAVKLLEHAVELEPEDPTINGHLGDAYWAVGRRLEAIFQWRRALTLNPEPEDAARIEGRLHDTAALADPPASAAAGRTIQ